MARKTVLPAMNQQNNNWDLTITPKDKLLAVDWKEIWRYRDMFVLFVERTFRVAYKQTVLGPLWFIITPVLSVIVYVTVFGGIANIPTDGVPPVLFYLLGISVWGYFASCLSATSNSFVSNADIFGKVYFPRIIMPLVAVTTNLLSFAIQLAIFAAFYIYYVAIGTELTIHWQLVLFPFLIILLALMAVGFGMIFSSLTTKYRDLQIMLAKIISLWVYITPVIYPLSMVTNEKLHLAMSLNPVTPVMEAIKYSLLGQGQFSWLWLGYSVAFTAVLLVFGLMLFNKVQKSFMDTV
jgi:lipopolysaccharide transport system permease protein